MKRGILSIAWIVLALASTADAADTLIPAGSINAAMTKPPILFVIEEDPGVRAHARGIRDTFFKDAEIVTGAEALARDLGGFNLIVYGTPAGNAWVRAHADALPFAFDDGGVTIQERRFEGEHLRAICAVRNPANTDRCVVVYATRRPEDIPGINNIFHGPTAWLVADGGRTLAAGEYVLTGDVPAAAMRTDLDFLVACVRDVHPATAEGMPPAVTAAIAEARAAITEPMPRARFQIVLNRVLLSLHDAHTSLASPRSPEGVDLPFRWLQDGMIVRADAGPLRLGDRVQSIGGRDEREILAALSDLIPAETPAWVRRSAERVLPDAVTLHRLGVLDGETLPLVVERDGETLALRLPLGAPPPPEPRPAWVRFTIDEAASLGVFTLDSCRDDEVYRERLHAFFEAVHAADIDRVAIDVRENGGGNSAVVNRFLRYLDVDAYQGYSGDVRVSEASLAQRTTDRFKPGYHEFRNRPKKNTPIEGMPAFGGEVFVLTSRGTFSSGNWFAVIFHDNDLGTILGESTGNAPSSFGDILTFTLPETAFTFTMSYKKWVRPDPTLDPAASLAPDVLIPLTRADLVAGTDPVLEHLRGLGRDPAPGAP